ncbi:MAG TPA: Uma2 family endonuclease [Gemmatimonadales bacterium]|nr:Uma2 family endonuclease [Gemmatimonadales bacterium]
MPEMLERWTAARVRELPDDGRRYEVVDGEVLVTPAPTFDHQRTVAELLLALHTYLDRIRAGEVAISPADIEFDPATLVQPDVFVVPLEGGRRPKRWADIRQLVLAIEVLSPSTARADRTVKRRRYQRAGVPECWVVDLDARLVERWRPGDERPEVLAERLVWHPDPEVPVFELDLVRFFARVLAEE